jgi:cytoskeletal protein RodZ
MSKRKQGASGFAAAETLLVLVIVVMIGFVGWFVVRAKQDANKTLDTSSSQAARNSGKTGGNDSQSLQDDLSNINSANNQTTLDFNTSNNSLNDSSTFTSLP